MVGNLRAAGGQNEARALPGTLEIPVVASFAFLSEMLCSRNTTGASKIEEYNLGR